MHGAVNRALLEAGVACLQREADRLERRRSRRPDRAGTARGVAVPRGPRICRRAADALAAGARRVGLYGRRHAGGRTPRRSGPGGVGRVHRRPDAVLPRGRRSGLRPRRLPPARDDHRPRPGPARPGDGLDRPPDATGTRRPAQGPDDRGDDARPRPDPPRLRVRRARAAARELRHGRHARPMARDALRTRRRELRRQVLGPRRAGDRSTRRPATGDRALAAGNGDAPRRVRRRRDGCPPLHRVPARHGDAGPHRRSTPATSSTSSSRPTPRSRTARVHELETTFVQERRVGAR